MTEKIKSNECGKLKNLDQCHNFLEKNSFQLCIYSCVPGESEISIYENPKKNFVINISENMIFFIQKTEKPLIAFPIDPVLLKKYFSKIK